MSITLTPQAEEMVRQKIEGGSYRTPDEVIEEALQALDERDRARHLRALLQIGIDQADRGEVVPYTPELWDEIEREVEERLLRGDMPRPEVCR